MARTASIAIGGYYPTPEHLVARVANLFAIAPHVDEEDDAPWRGKPTASFLDPCAGDGAAVNAFSMAVAGDRRAIYVCEMEASRAEALGRLSWSHGSVRVLRGDAFRVEMEKGAGISCLYLNPPYDLDRVHGRLEQRFLSRFAPMLMMGGYLVFVVPHYALAASAEHLAREFDKVSCFRFPSGDFDVFKQVVLVARKAETFATQRADVERLVRGWSSDVSSCEDLPEANAPVGSAFVLPTSRQQAIDTWNMRPVDVAHALTMAKPWSQTTRRGAVATIPGLLPDGPVQDLLLRRYPVATPPRPAHIASGIASGIFNGSRIDATPEGMPSLLVKGVFTREFRTIEEKTNRDGDVTAEVQVQQPKLVTTVLDLSTYTYHTLSHGKSGSTEVAQMGIMDLLENYGSGLMTVMESQCPILYDPRRDAAEVSLPASPRKLFQAQQHACRAIVKLLGGPHATRKERCGKAAFLLGEIGSGKSTVALVSAKAIGSKRPLVLCPPHLLTSWTNEARAVFPDAEVRVLTNVSEVDALASDTSNRMIVAVMSREAAKLGHGWEPVGMVCPTCGTTPSTTGMDQVKKRARCSFRPITPKDVQEARDTDGAEEEEARTLALLARSAIKLAHLLANHAPNDDTVRACMHGRFDEVRRERHKERPWAGLPRGYLKDVTTALVARLQKAGGHDETQAAGRALIFALLADYDIATVSSVVTQLLPKTAYDYANNAFHVAQLLPRASKEWSAAAEAAIGVNGSRHWSSPWETAKNETLSEENVFGFTLHRGYGGLEYNYVRENSLEASIAVLRALGRAGAFVRGKECGEFLYQAVPEPRRVALAKYITRRHPGMFDALALDECFVAGTMIDGVPIERIVVGDVIDTYDESTRQVVRRRVTRLFRNQASHLVRITTQIGTSIVCTWNHPIMSGDGWKMAVNIRKGESVYHADMVRCVSNVRRLTDTAAGPVRCCGNQEGICILRSAMLPDSQVCIRWSGRDLEWRMPYVPVSYRQDRERGHCGAHTRVRVLLQSVRTEPKDEGGSRDMGWAMRMVPDHVRRIAWCSHTPGHVERVCVLPEGMRSPWEECSDRSIKQEDIREGGSSGGHFCTHEVYQPHGLGSECREDAAEADRKNLLVARREWAAYQAADRLGRCAWLGDGGFYQYCSSEKQVSFATECLQGRHRQRGTPDRCRGGRGDTQDEEVEVPGQAQGGGVAISRVESVEVLERGSDGTFGPVCPDGLVYNIEVEGTHTYFANGILAHNCHEYGNADSGQSAAAHRLSGLGLPTILMTGSVMNGYAESLFANMWALSPSFREEFSREDKQRFIDRYGYRKRIVEAKEEGKVVAFGKVSDRVERVERPAGNAPGILPVFVLRHLLPMSVTLHKADLAIDLPPCTIERHFVSAEKDILDGYKSLRDKLVRQIREDAFDPERAGKLFGQLAEMPSYLDRATADVGNDDSGDFSICYPESVGGGVVASVEGKTAARILAKEEWMLRQVEQELAEGRNVMVFSWHLGLLPRLARLLAERTGSFVPVLNADRVPASKRQAWIDREVIKKGARVLVTNPVCIQTGLNNLIHFATEIWMENPACNPITFRQAIGRIDRIGQKLPSRIHFPIYGGTLQEKLYDLLMHKVAVSVATDGLDPESALQAAGVGDDEYMTGLSIGKQIYAMLTALRSDRLASQHDRWYAFGMDHSVKVALLVYAACGFVWMLRGAWKIYEAIGDEEKRAWMDSQLPPGFSLDDRHVAFGAAIGMAILVAINGILWPYKVASYVWARITYKACACPMCESARRDDDVPPASADEADDNAKK